MRRRSSLFLAASGRFWAAILLGLAGGLLFGRLASAHCYEDKSCSDCVFARFVYDECCHPDTGCFWPQPPWQWWEFRREVLKDPETEEVKGWITHSRSEESGPCCEAGVHPLPPP